jgi:hypothetical protein
MLKTFLNIFGRIESDNKYQQPEDSQEPFIAKFEVRQLKVKDKKVEIDKFLEENKLK